jgi:diacylglycerol kinase (ATP)
LRHFAATEHNGWLHAAATLVVILLSTLLRISLAEWRWIILAIILVWLAEALNTAVERLADAITVEPNERIGFAKDVAAGAVLVAATGSALIGLTVFVPRMIALVL